MWKSLLLCAVCAAPSLAQQPSPVLRAQPFGWKDPELASILSFVVPGAGQLYAGRPDKGSLIFGGTALATGVAIFEAAQTSCVTAYGGSCSSRTVAAISGATAAAIWIVGWVTAPRDARVHNERLLSEAGLAAPIDQCRDKHRVARDGDDLTVTAHRLVGGLCTAAPTCRYRGAALTMSRDDAITQCLHDAKREP